MMDAPAAAAAASAAAVAAPGFFPAAPTSWLVQFKLQGLGERFCFLTLAKPWFKPFFFNSGRYTWVANGTTFFLLRSSPLSTMAPSKGAGSASGIV